MFNLAQTNFGEWNDALKSLDPDRVSALYAKDLSFLPTLSDEFVVTDADEERYFVHFLMKHPQGSVQEDKVQALGTGAFMHSGLYNFEVNTTADNHVTIFARFSFLWRKFGVTWQIMHHHSSLVPTVSALPPRLALSELTDILENAFASWSARVITSRALPDHQPALHGVSTPPVCNFDLDKRSRAHMSALARRNFDEWADALLSLDPDRVSALYATDVSFLPTLSPQFVVSDRDEERYFDHFLLKHPRAAIRVDKVQPLGTQAYVHSGLYDFEVPPPPRLPRRPCHRPSHPPQPPPSPPLLPPPPPHRVATAAAAAAAAAAA
jgi:hypothetical protein